MQRYAFTVEYDGIPFCGWQIQPNRLSVQGVLQAKLTEHLKINLSTPLSIHGASRTDARVSARGQVCHIDLPFQYPESYIASVPLREYPISISNVKKVSHDFHAQHAVVSKTYSYTLILQRHRPILQRGWWVKGCLDISKIERALKEFIGLHDFTSFCSIHAVGNRMRAIDNISLTTDSNSARLTFCASGFLMHQIRVIVGTLVDIGFERIHDLEKIYSLRDRSAAGQTAPGDGLVLEQIQYKSEY